MSTKRQPTSVAKRKRKKWLMNKIVWPLLAPLGVVIFILLLPILAPFLAVKIWFGTRRKRALVTRFPCTRCGVILGEGALRLANAVRVERGQQIRQWRRENPHMKYWPAPTPDAVCGNCGQRFTYQEKGKTFVEEGGGQRADGREA